MIPIRVGNGYDVHRLVADRPLVIGGVHINWHMGLDGHSDADVLLHAICDGLSGAAGLGDIGQHFPPSDENLKNMDSRRFVRQVRALLSKEGWVTGNIDATIVAEKPEMLPHIPAMKAIIAEDLAIDITQVNIKATTTEGLGFCGQQKGIAAYTSVLISKS